MTSNYHQQRNTPTAAESKRPLVRQFKIGIDEHTVFCVISLQRDHGAISTGRHVSRAELIELVEQATAAKAIHKKAVREAETSAQSSTLGAEIESQICPINAESDPFDRSASNP